MKSLTWFQARELARVERRAVRREGWRHWVLYRFYLWLVSELAEDGSERRRVVTALDFRDSEFLAKDWTDEPWEGGTTPPCTTLPPATAIPPGVGAGVFTDTDRCGGDGQGGLVPPVIPPGGDGTTGGATGVEATIRTLSLVTGRPLLVPDGSGCWITPPATYGVAILCRLGAQVQPGGDFWAWFSNTGANLGVDVALGGAIAGASAYGPQRHNPGTFSPAYDWAADWGVYDGRFVIDPASGHTALTFPGFASTITARVDYLSPAGQRSSALATFIFAAECIED
jgi:hypothetical protein